MQQLESPLGASLHGEKEEEAGGGRKQAEQKSILSGALRSDARGAMACSTARCGFETSDGSVVPSKGEISRQGRGQRGQRPEGRVPDPWQLHFLPFDEFLDELFTCTRF